MNLVGDEQRRHKKGRSKAEKIFKTINMIILAFHAGCFLLTFAYCYIAATYTFEGNFMSPGDFVLAGGYSISTETCRFNTTMDIRGFSQVPMTLTADNHYRLITQAGSSIRTTFIVGAISLGLSAVTKLLFDANFFFIRFRHFVFHKEIITTVEVVLIMLTYYFITTTMPFAKKVDEYFRYCGSTSDSVFVLPLWASLLVGNSLNFGVSMIGFCSYIHTTCFTDTEKLSGVPAHDTPAGIKRGLDYQFQQQDRYGSYTLDEDLQGEGERGEVAQGEQLEQQQQIYSPQGVPEGQVYFENYDGHGTTAAATSDAYPPSMGYDQHQQQQQEMRRQIQ